MDPSITDVLVPRVPPERWPKGGRGVELLLCGPNGRLLEVQYPGQKFLWRLYEQQGHAGAGIIVADCPGGKRYVALVHQWRPGDIDSIELPAGNIGTKPLSMVHNFLKEVVEEVGGQLTIHKVTACQGFAHDIAREIVANGEGPKCFFYFLVECSSSLESHSFHKGDEKTACRWYPVEEVVSLVKAGRIADMVTVFGLLLTGIIGPLDLFASCGETSFDITAEVRKQAKKLISGGLRVVNEP